MKKFYLVLGTGVHTNKEYVHRKKMKKKIFESIIIFIMHILINSTVEVSLMVREAASKNKDISYCIHLNLKNVSVYVTEGVSLVQAF